MPRPGMVWRHVILSTRRSWLHGSERGFRSRRHRIHSSGDYKNPPPAGEHEGLGRYHRRRLRGPVVKIPKHLRRELGLVVLRKTVALGYRVLVVAVTSKHVHLLVELPVSPRLARQVVGKVKCARSPALRRALPGEIWAAGGKFKPVRDRAHQLAAFGYIKDDQGPGAWVWTFHEPVPPPQRRQRNKATRERQLPPTKEKGRTPPTPTSRGRSGARHERSGAPDRAGNR